MNSPEYKATSTNINSHVALNKVFIQLKELNTCMYLKWENIYEIRKELIKNKLAHKDLLYSVKYYQKEVDTYIILLSITNLTTSDMQKYKAEINGTTTNIETRKASLKDFYAEAFQKFKFEQEDLRSAERLAHQQELDNLAKQVITLQNDNKQLS